MMMKAAGSSEKLISYTTTKLHVVGSQKTDFFFKNLIVTLKNIMCVICDLKLSWK